MCFTLAFFAKFIGPVYRKIKRLPVGFPLNVIEAIDIGHSSRLLELKEIQEGEVGCLCKR